MCISLYKYIVVVLRAQSNEAYRAVLYHLREKLRKIVFKEFDFAYTNWNSARFDFSGTITVIEDHKLKQ